MVLRLVLGRAGSGKTAHCLRSAAAELRRSPLGPPLLLLVPEQATFQMEQALLRALGGGGFARAAVLSFQRLAWRVLQETGGGARPVIGEMGRRMAVRALLARHGGELKLFGALADRPGCVEHLAGTLAELAAWGAGADELRRQAEALDLAGRGDTALAAKLNDLRVLLQAYESYLRDRFTDPADLLDAVASRMASSALARGARVWVDGFSGFTTRELAVLGALMRSAASVEFTLCLDPASPDGGESGLFAPTEETRRQLLALAEQAGVPRGADLCLPEPAGAAPPRFRRPVLAHVERQAFRYPGEPFGGPPEGLRLVEAADRRQEVEAAARAIRTLVREAGYRFRDVSVIARDLDAYHNLIQSAFTAADLPFFVDRRRPVAHHPLVELLRAALEAVAGDWAYEPVFRYLKTDLVPLGRHDVDRLEAYVLEFGLRGRRWYEGGPWGFRRRFTLEEDEPPEPADEARLREVNRIRGEAARDLLALQRRVEPARRGRLPVRVLSEAVYGLLHDLQVPERVRAWSAEAEAAGDLDGAQEHLQVWAGVVELLDQTVEALGDVELSLGSYLGVVEAGLDSLRVGLVPPGLDQILVGSVERSRHPDVRATFILGATEGAFPRRIEEDAVLSDRDREELAERGLALAPPSRVQSLHEQYLTYIALTRASDLLWLSRPLADAEGRSLAPAALLRRLQVLVPRLAPEPAEAASDDPRAAAGPDQLLAALARRLRRAAEGEALPEPWLQTLRWAAGEPRLAARLRRTLGGPAGGNGAPDLAPEVARGLYGDVLTASVSRLESFAACPFQHFAAHGLHLRPRLQAHLGPAQVGELHHAALSLISRHLDGAGADWAELTAGSAVALVDRALAELTPRLQGEVLASAGRRRHLARAVARTLSTAVENLAEHARRGRFRPVSVEAVFGPGPEASLPPLELPLPSGGRLLLRGRIDRVEAAEDSSGRRLLRVVDFKSRPRDLALDHLYHGLALQLALYLLVASETAGGEPAGLLYIPVVDPLVRSEAPLEAGEVAARRRRSLRAGGWVLADPEALRAMDATNAGDLVPAHLTQRGVAAANSHAASGPQLALALGHARRLAVDGAEAIRAGRVDVSPYRLGEERACTHCRFHAVCRFDPALPGNAYRVLPRLASDEVWRRLGGGGGGGDAGAQPGGDGAGGGGGGDAGGGAQPGGDAEGGGGHGG